MFAKWLSADSWHDRRSDDTEIQNPTWQEVERCLVLLDGKTRTLVTLSKECGSEWYLMIAGQWDGRCLVNATKNNIDFFSLVDTTRKKEKQVLFVGGQNGDFEERKIVPFVWALAAAKTFYETGGFDASLCWKSDR